MAYKLAVLEILGNLFALAYIACRAIPTYRVYRLYDTEGPVTLIMDLHDRNYLNQNKNHLHA